MYESAIIYLFSNYSLVMMFMIPVVVFMMFWFMIICMVVVMFMTPMIFMVGFMLAPMVLVMTVTSGMYVGMRMSMFIWTVVDCASSVDISSSWKEQEASVQPRFNKLISFIYQARSFWLQLYNHVCRQRSERLSYGHRGPWVRMIPSYFPSHRHFLCES